MYFEWCSLSNGVFRREFRVQLLASLTVTLITFCHGIGLGWFTPMVANLQSFHETPLNFIVSVNEGSWIGALVCLGGVTGNLLFGQLIDRIGRKGCIYLLAVPHLTFWGLIYFADSVQYLYAARFMGGITGGGTYVVLPIYIGDIADSSIRGRLTSLFTLTLNCGMSVGFILATHLDYCTIPRVTIALPLLYLIFEFFFPETPQQLLRHGKIAEAEKSFKFYHNFQGNSKEEIQRINEQFHVMETLITKQRSNKDHVQLKDFYSRPALKAFRTGIILMLVNVFCGSFALISYMSIIFSKIHTELHPNTNTIIIGVVQIVGTYTATILVDLCGRKILLIISTAAMGLGLAAFGMYAFFAEETSYDLSGVRTWLPILLMATIIFVANIGINPVPFVVLVEVMPTKIRSVAASFCLALLSFFAFIMIKVFPILMDFFGLSATIWFCATVCAFGLFYVTVFLKETKGKCIEKDDVEE